MNSKVMSLLNFGDFLKNNRGLLYLLLENVTVKPLQQDFIRGVFFIIAAVLIIISTSVKP